MITSARFLNRPLRFYFVCSVPIIGDVPNIYDINQTTTCGTVYIIATMLIAEV